MTHQSNRPTVEFDHHSPNFAQNWRAITADLRSRCPVAWTEANGGHWVVTSYNLVRSVALDDETFSSDNDMTGERKGYEGAGAIPRSPFQLIPLEVDPPLFYSYRKLLNPKFSPAAAEKWRPFVRQVTNAMIDRICREGRCDIVKDLASPIPAMTTMRLLGLPLTDWEEVGTPFHDIAAEAAGSPGHQRAIEGMLRVMVRLTEELAKRRVEPREDMLSFLAFSEIDGRALSEEEIIKICFLLLIGGVDTSTGLLAYTFSWLSDHPEERQRLLDAPNYLRTATEEFLRWASPAPALARTVTRETELGGQKLCPGERLLLSWLSANHDGTVFDDPEDVRLDRWPNKHQAFGHGIHRCLGSNIGRVQFQEALVTILRRLPDLTADMQAAQLYPSLGQANGYATLPATFTPVEPVGAQLPD